MVATTPWFILKNFVVPKIRLKPRATKEYIDPAIILLTMSCGMIEFIYLCAKNTFSNNPEEIIC